MGSKVLDAGMWAVALTLAATGCQNWGNFWQVRAALYPKITGLSADWGGAGDSIRINGSGFGNSASDLNVTFSGTKAVIRSVSDNSIEALVPANIVSGYVSVTDWSGNAATSPKEFRFNKYYLYVATQTGIYGFDFDQTSGSLKVISGLPFPTANATGSILAAFEYRYLYATSFSGNVVGMFSIDNRTGQISSLGTVATGTNPAYLCMDSKSRYLYVANGAAAQIRGYGINSSTGGLTPLPGSPYTAGSQTLGIAITPDDSYVFVNQETANQTRSYAVAADGSLSPVSTQSAGTATRGLVIHPTLPYVYNTNTTSQNIYGYQYDRANGTFGPLPGFPVALTTYTPWMEFDKSGKYLYIASQSAVLGVYGFSVDQANGSLSAISGSPFTATSFDSRGLAIDPYNRYMVVGQSVNNLIAMFSLNSDGTLTAIPGQTHGVGNQPQRSVFVSAKQ